MSAPLAEVDPDIAGLLDKELRRQRDTLYDGIEEWELHGRVE